jgi:ubiquinone/menaquinone biosynthesis C-methylase UbiE
VPLDEQFAAQVREHAKIIRNLVKTIKNNRNINQEVCEIARQRARRPIDYMRYAEFAAVLARLELRDGSRVLDAAGPQWLTLALAAQHPNIEFHYVNLTDYEILPFEEIRKLLQLDNLTIRHEDLRNLSFPDEYFDEIVSISVLEHVYPEEGGDDTALAELKRVMRTDGSIIMTVPCKEKANVVYVQGNVYERTAAGKQFFAREYDPQTLRALINRGGFFCEALNYISEVPSLMSIDYLEWGPLRGTVQARLLLKLYRGTEKFLRIPVEEILAFHKLSVTTGGAPRLVNAALHLRRNAPGVDDSESKYLVTTY